jgi:hypothetical protein
MATHTGHRKGLRSPERSGGSHATGTGMGAASRPRVSRPDRPIGTALALVTLLAGLWLVVAPAVGGYGTISGGVRRWNDVAVGFLVAVVSLVLMEFPVRRHVFGRFLTLLAAWIVLTPAALGDGGVTAVTVNHLVTGTVVGVAGLAATVAGARDTRNVARRLSPSVSRPPSREHGASPGDATGA